MGDDSLQLVIKVPNQTITDQTVDCALNWSILRLKTHIFNVFPTKPKVEDQKLIYGGRMLSDDLTLKEVLKNETGQKHTLHLVCASNNQTNPRRESETNSTPSSSQQGTPGTSLHYRGVRPNGESFANVSHTEIPQVQMPGAGGPPINNEMMAQQMAAMQQFYAQYMAQLMQNAQMAGFGTYPNLGFSPVFASTAGTVPVNAPQGFVPAPQNAPRANNAAPAANPNIRMNAQGGAVLDEDEEDAENRDWLDWFYIVCRAIVLFSVVYFYSSLSRFMVVFGLTILVYMYQGGWFGNRPVGNGQPNADANRPAAPNPNEAAQPQENEPVRENEEPVSSPTVQPNGENEEQVNEELREMQRLMDGEIEPRHTRPEPSYFHLIKSFCTTFFTSMIPEQPAPLNIN